MKKLNGWDFLFCLFVFCHDVKFSLAFALVTFLLVVTKCPRKATEGRKGEGREEGAKSGRFCLTA